MGHWDDEQPEFSEWQKDVDLDEHWRRKLRQARQTPAPGALRLGTNLATGDKLYIDPKQLSTHMQVIGATGLGKTFFLEGLIKQLAVEGHGLAVLDPHGDLYDRLLLFFAYLDRERPDLRLSERVIPFNIADTANILGFNPVARNARVMTYQVVALMEAIRKCWGQDSFEATPRLARWLFNAGYAVVDSGLTLYQTRHMVNPTNPLQRSAIISKIKDPDIRAEWEGISKLKITMQEERLESSYNKLKLFVSHEILKLIIGQYTNTVDFPAILDDNKILLVNLARQGVMTDENRHMLGTMIVNELLTAAFARPEGERPPFYAFIDEFQHFVTKDMCEILDGGRKFGLHLILAHQHLKQTEKKEPEVYYSALTNARTKVVFGGLIDEDVEIMAKELYTGELDPDEIKDVIETIVWDPVESTRVISVDNWASSSSSGRGHISHESLASGQVFLPDSNFLSLPEIVSTSQTAGRGRTSTSSDADSRSSGGSQSVVPWYEFHARKQISSRTFRALEEQLYKKKALLKRQPQQHAAVFTPGSQVQLIKTPTLADDPPVADRQVTEFKQACMQAARCYKTPPEAEREIASMEQRLLEGARDSITVSSQAESEPAKPSRGGRFDDYFGKT
jgi:hypothetical protein